MEPTSNGIGGDAFAIVWTKGELHGLNASGPSPKSISIEAVKARGYEAIPKYGMIPVTVPGAPAAWAELSKRFGKLPLTEVLRPAIEYATNGFPITPTLSNSWRVAFKRYAEEKVDSEEVFNEWYRIFAPDGRAPKAGEMWRSPDHAKDAAVNS